MTTPRKSATRKATPAVYQRDGAWVHEPPRPVCGSGMKSSLPGRAASPDAIAGAFEGRIQRDVSFVAQEINRQLEASFGFAEVWLLGEFCRRVSDQIAEEYREVGWTVERGGPGLRHIIVTPEGLCDPLAMIGASSRREA